MAARGSQGTLFETVLDRLPDALKSGLRSAGLDDPRLLDNYTRDEREAFIAAVTGFDTAAVGIGVATGSVASTDVVATMASGGGRYIFVSPSAPVSSLCLPARLSVRIGDGF